MSRLAAWLPRSLHLRLAVLISLASLITGVALGAYTITTESRAALTNIRHQTLAMARSMAVSVVNPLLTNQLDAVEEALLREAAFPGVLTIYVTDVGGTILGHVQGHDDAPPTLLFDQPNQKIEVPPPAQLDAPPVTVVQQMPAPGRMQAWMPVKAGQALGWVRVDLSLQPLQALSHQVWQRTLAAGVLWVLGSGAWLWWLLRGPMRSLDEAHDFAASLVQADGQQLKVDPQGPIEIVELGLALNSASTQLCQQREIIAAAMQQVQQSRAELQDRNLQLASIFELSPDGLVSLDGQGFVRYANPAFFDITGLQADEVLDRGQAELAASLGAKAVPPAAWPGLAHFFEPAEAHTGLRGHQLTIATPQHRVLAVLGRHARQDGSDTTGGVTDLLYLRDVTRETEVDRMKTEFLSTAAHELRTPIASIFGFAELLQTGRMAPERVPGMVGTIHRNAKILTHILDDLLDLSTIEARRDADFARQRHDLAHLVEQTVQGFLPPPGREAPVLQAVPAALPVVVDASRMARVVVNLLSNAFKYSPQGGVVRVCWLQDLQVDGSGRVGFAVQDQGLGLTPEQRGRLFERFYRADPSGTILGTGLGLSIVKEIVQLHQGSITVDSAPGLGSTFTVWLPLAEAEPAASDASATVPAAALMG